MTRLTKKIHSFAKDHLVFVLTGLFCMSLALGLGISRSASAFDSGDGSIGSPYQISTCVQLQSITNLSAYYELSGPIDCSDTINWNSGQGFATIPSSGSFTGSFDGNGNTISGLYINRPTSFQGMFRTLGAGANVREFTITGAQVTSTSNSGILAGTLSGNPAITDVSISGTLSSTSGAIGMAAGSSTGAVLTRVTTSGSVTSSSTSGAYVGGLIGEAGSTGVGTQIIDSSSSANVSSASNSTGGLVGGAYFGSYNASTQLISGSYATGSVTNTGTGQAGGLVGQTTNYRIYRSYATGTVTGTGFSGTGGLTGTFSGSGEIVESYAAGNVTATGSNQTVGGLVGSFGVSTSIVRSFAVGNARGETRVGGLIGASGGGTISDSYARGRATATTGSPVGSVSARGTGTINRSYGTGLLTSSGTKFGLAGDASFTPTCNDSFWDTQTTVVATTVCGGTGKTTSEMQNVATFTNTGTSPGLTSAWDFAGTQNNDAGNNDYWDIDPVKNDGYPFLTWQTVWPAVPSPNANPTVSTLGPTAYVNGSWGTDTTPSVTFTLGDTDGSDTVRYQIQIDDTSSFASPVINYTSALGTTGSKTFTVGQAAGTGTYTVGSSGQTLSSGTYYWRVKAIDSNSAESSYSAANSGAIAFGIDTAGPTTPGTPSTTNPTNDTTPTWTWTASTDSGSGLAGTAYTMSWSQASDFSTGVSAASSATNSYTHSIALAEGTWYFRVTAWDALNQSSTVSASGTVVIDTTAPTLQSTTPADNATNVALNQNLIMTFSEAVTVGTGNVVIKRTSDASTFETIDITGPKVTGSGTTSITVNPDAVFAEDTGYYITIASTALRDSTSNAYSGISDVINMGGNFGVASADTWNFTTTNLVEPVITSPSNGASVNDIYLDFSVGEAMTSGTLQLVFSGSASRTLTLTDYAVGTHSIIIDPANPTANSNIASITGGSTIPDGTYTLTLQHRDINNLVTLSDSASSITVDNTAPTVDTRSPVHTAAGVAVNANLSLTFDEPVGWTSGQIRIRKVSDNAVIETIDVAGGTVSGSGTTTLTINPVNDLVNAIAYYVEIDSTAIRDLTGNDFTGITGSSSWRFSTVGTGSGKVASSPGSITVTEGSSKLVGLLLSDPIISAADVTVNISVSDPTQSSVSPSSLSFLTASWSEAKDFSLSTVDDTEVNGSREVVVTLTAVSDAVYYDGYQSTITVTINDNDTAEAPTQANQEDASGGGGGSDQTTITTRSSSGNQSGRTEVDPEEGQSENGELTKILLDDFQEYMNGQGKPLDLRVGQVVYFTVGSDEHSATVQEVGDDYVVLVLASTPQTVRLAVGETGRYDVSEDDKQDIEVTVKGVTNGIASLSFKALTEKAKAPVSSNDTALGRTTNNFFWILIGGGLALLLFIIILGRFWSNDRTQSQKQ